MKNSSDILNLSDKMNLAIRKNVSSFSKFLSLSEQSEARDFFTANKFYDYIFTGGNEESERKICIFSPYDHMDMPYVALRIHKSPKDELGHRDYLGSLMSLGIKREFVGDIFVHDMGADIIVLHEMVDFIKLNYEKAGRKTLKVEEIDLSEVESNVSSGEVKRDTISSLRLDAFLASVFNMSRQKAIECISAKRVFLNDVLILKADKKINENDKINLRGKGKAQLISVIGESKKGKIIIEIKKW